MSQLPFPFGFSTGSFYPYSDLNQVISYLTSLPVNAIEINFGRPKELDHFNSKTLSLLRSFSHISIHAPFVGVRYNSSSSPLLHQLLQIQQQTHARYILFHPDLVDDFKLIQQVLGPLAAYENMDCRKNFGNSLADLETIFALHPEAGWVYDLNHVFTLDPTMNLGEKLYQTFKTKLVGYHLSGYGNEKLLHTLLYQTQELPILQALHNYQVPVIHEGICSHIDKLNQEINYLQTHFQSSQ